MTDTAPVHLERDVMGRLVLRGPDGIQAAVRPIRLFPLSNPGGYIALVDHDDQELGLVRDIAELDVVSQEALQEELTVAYVVPEIECVYSLEEEFGVLHWHVQTDRGERRFDVRGRDEVHFIGHGHYIVRDIDGNRFEIRHLQALDRRSQALLDTCV